MENNKFIRISNYELLRIVAMAMVIGLHYLLFGGALKNINAGMHNYYIVVFIESLFIIAVNLFVIISGYFMCTKNKICISKVFSLIALTYFYGIMFYLFSVIAGYEKLSIIGIIKAIDPLVKNWYVKTYVVLYMISPYINILLNNINSSLHKKLIYLLSLFFCIWPSFLPNAPNNDGGYGIISFIFIYIIAGYIRKYDIRESFKKRSLIIYIICAIITFLFKVINWDSAWSYNFLFNIIGAVALFSSFSKINLKSTNVNCISKFTFAIFIIHINPVFVDMVYNRILKCSQIYSNKYFIFYVIIGIIAIYLIALIIELIRQLIIKGILKILPNIIKFTLSKYKKQVCEGLSNIFY